MPEQIREPVTVKYVDYICDQCEEGKMIPTGRCKMVYPPIYEHKCNRCGAKEYFKEIYPAIRYI